MQINIEENQREKKLHGEYGFPVNISEESIRRYEGFAFMWHWHPEIELTWIRKGEIQYKVNDKTYHLHEGEGLFCNSNALHSGHMSNGQPCEYLSITFHPRMIYGYETSIVKEKYTDYITENPNWTSLALSPERSWQKDVLLKMKELYLLSKQPDEVFQLEAHIILCQIWKALYQYFVDLPETQPQTSRYLERLRNIITYIQEHYSEPITLDDIADHVNICKSECCRFFKKHMKLTLFDYLLFYRIQESLPLLRDGGTITQVAAQVGFSDSCYFSKIFRRYMNCTPTQYKKSIYK